VNEHQPNTLQDIVLIHTFTMIQWFAQFLHRCVMTGLDWTGWFLFQWDAQCPFDLFL